MQENLQIQAKYDVLEQLADHHLFEKMNDPIYDDEVLQNHQIKLYNLIPDNYLTVRFHHEAKKYSSQMKGVQIRQKLSKIVLFKLRYVQNIYFIQYLFVMIIVCK